MRSSSFAFFNCLLICASAVAGATSPGTISSLISFGDTFNNPRTGVILGADNVIYGTLWSPNGTVYSLAPPTSGTGWVFTVLYTFSGGAASSGVALNDLVVDDKGVIYGTAAFGGNTESPCFSDGCGFAYSLMPPSTPGGLWTETTLYEFLGGDDGSRPLAGVSIGAGGVLYGTTEIKGHRHGTAYSLTPPTSPGGSWTMTTLYTFLGGTDGAAPAAPLTIDSSGTLYGTTLYGGDANHGTVFTLSPPEPLGDVWTETVIHAFNGTIDGSQPSGGVIIGASGVLYGANSVGGTASGGVIYSLSPPLVQGSQWTSAVLHGFSLKAGEFLKPGPVALGPEGILYGSTVYGGSSHEGTVFEMRFKAPGLPWDFLTLYSFSQLNGTYPAVSEILTVAPGGLVWGTTSEGGASGLGTVFSLHP